MHKSILCETYTPKTGRTATNMVRWQQNTLHAVTKKNTVDKKTETADANSLVVPVPVTSKVDQCTGG